MATTMRAPDSDVPLHYDAELHIIIHNKINGIKRLLPAQSHTQQLYFARTSGTTGL